MCVFIVTVLLGRQLRCWCTLALLTSSKTRPGAIWLADPISIFYQPLLRACVLNRLIWLIMKFSHSHRQLFDKQESGEGWFSSSDIMYSWKTHVYQISVSKASSKILFGWKTISTSEADSQVAAHHQTWPSNTFFTPSHFECHTILFLKFISKLDN